jgi:hypothetical protein
VVGGADVGVHVRDLPLREGVEAARRALRRDEGALVDLLRLAVLAEVVEGHGEVERRLGVGRVDLEGLAEHPLGLGELALLMVDDAHHVVDVGVGDVLAQHLGEAGLGLVVLARDVVLAAAHDQVAHGVFRAVIHGRLLRGVWGSRRSASG